MGFTQRGNWYTCNQVEGVYQMLLTLLIKQLFDDVRRELLVTLV